METIAQVTCRAPKQKCKRLNLRYLRISLKYRPEILKLLLAMRNTNRKKTALVKKLQYNLRILASMCGIDLHSLELSNKTKTEYVESTVNQETKENDSMTDTKSVDVDNKKKTKTRSSQTKRKIRHVFTQTDTDKDFIVNNGNKSAVEKSSTVDTKEEPAGWNIGQGDGETKSIADQVKEAAQSAMQQSGMVYVEAAGMYYDYKTGYYYHPELGLYYHQDTGCYYTYYDEKQEFVFHSYPDHKASAANANLIAHEKRKARKQKKEEDQATKPKRKKAGDKKQKKTTVKEDPNAGDKKKQKKTDKGDSYDKGEKMQKITADKPNSDSVMEKKLKQSDKGDSNTDVEMKEIDSDVISYGIEKDKIPEETSKDSLDEDSKEEIPDETKIEQKSNEVPKAEQKNDEEDDGAIEDLEDGECSETASEAEDSDGVESDASTSTVSDDDVVAKHHPPCMRIIVRETSLPKLKVGSLYLVTKDGGTVGREGEHHTILLKDQNVSRNHLDIRYDMERRLYMATDLGSKNGTMLNGIQMSLSQVTSQPMEVIHGSTIQLGETKLLCHIHPGNDTCGHCEPGLIMESLEKEKVAYTRTCSVKKQHQLELGRLKNKYTPEPLMIEDGAYNDRAKARRETVGSSHHSVKTESADVATFIAPENKGFKLLEKMGWSKGEGLGKESQGEVEPVPIVSNEGTAGLGTGAVGAPKPPPRKPINKLGTATLRLAARSKMLQPPAKAFLDPLDDEDGDE